MSETAHSNPYLELALARLPGLLALFDTDPLSPTFGVGDRLYWAWKLSDFGNGTFQGTAHGLARLLNAGLMPPAYSESAVLGRIDSIFDGARRLTRKNGSLEEAYPFESSFCVTSLVAFDLLCAVELLGARISDIVRRRYLAIIAPMIRFLQSNDESHAVISNHLATAAAALFRWADACSGDGEERGRELLDRILHEQSSEGWFREYQGADPGYQTLATYYLADIHERREAAGLAEPLERSIRFLWHFAHPDGSFGGLYGSRNTRIFIPAGLELLAGRSAEAARLCRFMRGAIAARRTVTVDVIDPPNVVPIWNAYCRAAELLARQPPSPDADRTLLPCERPDSFRQYFSHAGLLIDGGVEHYRIISVHKGGVVYHFNKLTGTCKIDPGCAASDRRGRLYSSQVYQPANAVKFNEDSVVIDSELAAIRGSVPRPWQFVLLRIASMTVLRVAVINELVKRLLVKFLITGARRTGSVFRRTISLGRNLQVADVLEPGPMTLNRVAVTAPFSAIHMASHGYWQMQDDATEKNLSLTKWNENP